MVLAVSVATGAVAAEYEYDSFGQRTEIIATEEVRYGYTSREHDPQTGLMHYRARAYDPLTGTFLQRDPIGFAAGDLNLYAYVWGDPYNWSDPSGLTTVAVAGPGGSMDRDRAVRDAALPGIFGGVMNLANTIRRTLNAASAIGDVVAMSQEDSGEDDSVPDPTWGGVEGVNPDPDRPRLSGGGQQGRKDGGIEQAIEDFEDLVEGEVRELPNGGLQGVTIEGEGITLQPGSGAQSGDGPPTIYIGSGPGGRGNRIKIRYD